MKKGILFLIFAMIFTMIVPTQSLALSKGQLPVLDDYNGNFVVSAKNGDEWEEIGSLYFGKYQSSQTINVGSYLNCDNPILKLSQNGGGAAYLDAVFLDGHSAVKVNDSDEKVLSKLSNEDLDITLVDKEGVVLEFKTSGTNDNLTVVGRIESNVISKEPLQFPAENNYKSKDEVEDFYTYNLGSNFGTLKVDGILDEVSNKEPFAKEYRIPDSGHPAGDTYFWIMNDDENLYISMDVTLDNTFDGDKDYAKVYVKTDSGIEEYKISVPETTWGSTGFTYTDKVSYEHKVYEFSIPLNEFNASSVEKLSIAFVIYGTVSLDYNCNSPALAYDSNNEVYLSVFEHLYTYNNVNYQRIVGEFVDKSGTPIGYKFIIANSKIKDGEFEGILSDPEVAFNSETNEFLVTWVEYNESIDYVCAKKISYNSTYYEPFIVSSDDQSTHIIETPKVSYDIDNNVFLVVWQEANSTDEYSIYGQFLDANGSKIDSKFNISTTSEISKRSPSVCYSKGQEAFIVAWQNGGNITACGVKLLENNNKHVSNMIIIGEGENPDVSYNGSSQRLFVTWEYNGNLYGHYYDLTYSPGTNYLDPFSVSDILLISSPHDSYYVGYPSAYYDGYDNMLCVWSMFKPEQECFAEMCYIDIYAQQDGPPFYTDEELSNRDVIDGYKIQIAISGDNDIQNIIAYVLEDTGNIVYRIVGDYPEEPSLKYCENPDIAYDSNNELYLSVFEYREYDYDFNLLSSQIYGEVVDRDGNVVSDRFRISKNSELNFNYTPTVAYDSANEFFLVVWSTEFNEQVILVSTLVDFNESLEDIKVLDAVPISGNNFDNFSGNEEHPDLTCTNNGKFFLVWRQFQNDNFDIYGRILDESLGSNFFITNNSNNQMNPSVCYDEANDAFLVAWNYYGDEGEQIQAQVVSSSGELPIKGAIDIGGNLCSFPDVSYNTQNDQFFITWQDYSSGYTVIKGQYIGLNDELEPEKEQNEIKITPDDYYHSIYPASYEDGNGKLLCGWSSTLFEDNIYELRLQYIDQVGSYFGEAFYPDEYDEYYSRDNLTASSQISMSGDNEGSVIVAYYYEPEEQYRVFEYNSNEYELDINYLVFGEKYIEPKIEFSNAPFDEIMVGDTIQARIKLYNNEYPTGIEIYEDLFFFSENPEIAEIDRMTGLITGISEGETSVAAIYDPWAESDNDDVKFSDGAIFIEKPEKVKVIPKPLPTLDFDKETYSVQISKTVNFSVTLKNYNDIQSQDVTGIVAYNLGNSEIASISTSGAITGLTVGTTTVSAIYADSSIEPAFATIIVTPVSSGSSSTPRTPIGQILVDNKVLKNLYEEDVKVKNNTYTFTADKSGESARLWLDSDFYEDLAEYTNRAIQFNWNNGTYTLPLNCDEVLKEIDSSAKKVSIYIEKVDDDDIIKEAYESAEKMGAEIISQLIDFSVIVEKNNGNENIKSYDFYAERTINNIDNISENISTAMKFVEDKETLTFAPSIFDDDFATIKYRGNGIFTIIENPQTFSDIADHWAKTNIEKLATRNIAFGKENNNFAPQDFITRAEFAVMITRALGITEEEGSNEFKDVSSEWFAEDISTAFEKGLINGRTDGKFYPNEKIQRKDMAVMIQNALKFTGMYFDVSNAESILTKFNDSSTIADYARESTAICTEAGIIMGRETKNFDPDDYATRAEASAIIERMLRYVDFMD